MKKAITLFLKDKKGIISIELTVVVFAFVSFIYIMYDIYSSLSLQNKLERVTYATASVFRERSTLYPMLDDSQSKNPSICSEYTIDPNYCFRSYELFDQEQIEELRNLGSYLLSKEVDVMVDGLFHIQYKDSSEPTNPEALHSQLVKISGRTCSFGECSSSVSSYFSSLLEMVDPSNQFVNLLPWVNRVSGGSAYHKNSMIGRFVPLYRVTMCVANEESIYLKLTGRDTDSEALLPNLCHSVAVLSRCNSLAKADEACPVYIYPFL